jgi:methionyl-tRNA formyltransferase
MLSGWLGASMLKHCLEHHQVSIILTDNASTEISSIAKANDLPLFIGNTRNGRASSFMQTNPIDLLLSINYVFIVEHDIIVWPRLGAVNFHGSLLPKYRGRTPHVWAIINNECKTGVTAHIMTEECDEGSIIHQIEIPIHDDDTGGTLLAKYEQIYPNLIDDVIARFKQGIVDSKPQAHKKATYFGKRTPDDGQIDWDWQKERIRNWVRAQAHPYPGAFSYINGMKVIIDRVEYDDFGFHQNQPNGLVLSIDPVRVKTSNGVLKLTHIREGKSTINQGETFS